MSTPPSSPPAESARIQLQRALCVERLRMRWGAGSRGTHSVLVGALLVLAGIVALSPTPVLVAWALALCVVVGVRARLGLRFGPRLDVASASEVRRKERQLGTLGVAAHAVTGAGIWLLAPDAGLESAMALTLAAALVGMGTLVFHSMDVRAYNIGVTLNLGTVAAWWLFEGPGDAAAVIAGMVAIDGLLLLRQSVHQARALMLSVQERLKREALLARLAAEKRSAEAALTRVRDIEASKARFLAAASHDLRQPLHALSLFVGTLEPMIDDPEQARLMDRIASSTSALESLLGNLLDLARFDAGRIEPWCEDVDLQALLQRLAESFQPQARARELELAASLAPAWGHTDELLLERLLRNLVQNAIRYTDRGGVVLTLAPADEGWRITVADTGPGIAPADRQRIFEDLVQLSNPARRREAGVGLGLAIVRRIDRLLGLKLSLRTAEGQGSRFELHVPAARDARRAGRHIDIGEGESWLPPGMRVAVLDDDPLILDGMRSLLTGWRCEVETFTDGDALVRGVSRAPASFDLVLLDDMLPTGPSGLETAARLLDCGVPRDCISLVTGNNLATRLRALSDSGLRFQLKPVDPKTIRAMLVDASRIKFPGTALHPSLPCVS